MRKQSPLFLKDPDAILDYTLDWSSWLSAGDSLDTATFTAPAGITKVSESNTGTTATVILSGGTEGSTYEVLCRIVTDNGLQQDQSIKIKVTNR